jgi:hypothetical protein
MTSRIRSYALSPWLGVFFIIALITIRFVWVAGYHDFGWTYEPSYRILHGEVQFRDFIESHPPLTHYTLAAWMAVVGTSLWSYQTHLYIWWAVTLVIACVLVRRLSRDSTVALGAVLCVGTILFPFETQQAHNFAVSALSGLAIIFMADYHKTRRALFLVFAGFALALSVYAKQSVGLVMTLGAFAGLVCSCYMSERIKRVPHRCAPFVSGWLLGFLPIAVYFSSEAGLIEFFRQMFSDPAGSKGGPVVLLLRPLPRLNLTLSSPYRRVIEIVISVPILAAMFFLLWRRIRHVGAASADTDPQLEGNVNRESSLQTTGSVWIVVLFYCAFVLFAIVSLFHLPGLRTGVEGLSLQSISWKHLAMQLLYMMMSVIAIVGFLRSIPTKDGFLSFLSITLAASLFGHGMSSLNYALLICSVSVPIAMGILVRLGVTRHLSTVACSLAVVLLVVALVLTPYTSHSFAALTPFPSESRFAGLYSSPEYVAYIDSIERNIKPQIGEETTLWMISPGPHSAFGGSSVKSVSAMIFDSYNSRWEAPLRAEWESRFPEYVVFFPDYSTAPHAFFFQPEHFELWLRDHYSLVWQSTNEGITLWRLGHSQ